MDCAGISDAGALHSRNNLVFDRRQPVDFHPHTIAGLRERRIGRLADQNDIAGLKREEFADVRDQAIDGAHQIGDACAATEFTVDRDSNFAMALDPLISEPITQNPSRQRCRIAGR